MLKNVSVVFLIIVGLFLNFPQTVSGQSEKTKANLQSSQEDEFLTKLFKADYKQVDVVLHVDVKEYELVDSIGKGNCKEITGGGYCLYRLKGDVREIFKGKAARENFEFYTVVEASTAKKDFLLGEKLVFLEWGDNFPGKKRSLGTLENSTRSSIEKGVLETIRKIAKRKR
jgi:hypothetical protein